MIFKEKLKNKSKIFLDGGNGSEIAKLGGDMSPAFAALATITSPDIVVKVHENFINVGCDIITANTFATSRHVLDSLNRKNETEKFLIKCSETARLITASPKYSSLSLLSFDLLLCVRAFIK